MGNLHTAFSMWLPAPLCLTSLPGFFWNLPWYFHPFPPPSLQTRSEAINREAMMTSRLSSSTEEGRFPFSFPVELLWVFKENTTHILEEEGPRTAQPLTTGYQPLPCVAHSLNLRSSVFYMFASLQLGAKMPTPPLVSRDIL